MLIPETLFPAYSALIFGLGAALLLAVPFVALQYRLRGGLTVGIVVLDLLVLIYLFAIITYTLLPLPLREGDFCAVYDAQPQLVPGQFVADILREAAALGGGPLAYLRNPATLQVVFNIALFLPLGMIVRYFRKTSVLVTALIGFGTSLLVETTQITGDWFLYPCAYRLFDVDDLLANTAGALLGALLAPLLRVFPGQVAMRPGDPRKVTILRRWLGMLCDWLILTFGAATISFAYLALVSSRDTLNAGVDSFLRVTAGNLVIAAVQLVWVLRTGRTLGETIVRLEPVPPTRSRARLLRWGLGIGGYSVLIGVQEPLVTLVLSLTVLASVVAVAITRDRRGLTYVLNRWRIRDDRESPQHATGSPIGPEASVDR